MLGHDTVSSDSQCAEENATENRKEVANVECHDRQHAVTATSQKGYSVAEGNGNGVDSQKVTDSSKDGVQQGPDRIDTESPRPDDASLPLYHEDALLHSILRQCHALRISILGDPLGHGCLAGGGDIAPRSVAVQPACLKYRTESEKAAADTGQYDQEDARRGVGSSVGRSPGGGEERSGVVGLEEHVHATVTSRRGRRSVRRLICGSVGSGVGAVACVTRVELHSGRRW